MVLAELKQANLKKRGQWLKWLLPGYITHHSQATSSGVLVAIPDKLANHRATAVMPVSDEVTWCTCT